MRPAAWRPKAILPEHTASGFVFEKKVVTVFTPYDTNK